MLNPINIYLWINKNIKFVLFIIILLPANFLKCQSLLAQQKIEKVKEFNISNFKEELYIGTDRDIYITGEHVWVKVFKMDGLSHSPSDISKIIYLELLDKNNFPVRQLKVKTDIYSGSSGFILPDNISTGNYLIRAYTSWMQNSSADQFSYKTISVINPFESINHVKIPSKRMVADSISFFPEGGSFISGIKTKTLIRSLDKDGNPIIIHGAVVKIGGDTVCNVETKKDGKAQLDNNYYNYDSASGIIYTVDVSKPYGEKVTIISMADGAPFDLKKTYKIATSSYHKVAIYC